MLLAAYVPYAGQVWGTEFNKEDKVFTSDLQVIYPMKLQGYHQFSASAVELEFLRSERRFEIWQALCIKCCVLSF